MRVRVGGDEAAEDAAAKHLMMITVSNGANLGGMFRIAPNSSVCDGLLDVHAVTSPRINHLMQEGRLASMAATVFPPNPPATQ